MSDSKVLVFGSFAEDEITSILNPQPKKAEKPVVNVESPVDSLKFGTVLSFGSFNGKLEHKDLLKERNVAPPSNGVKPSDDLLPKALGSSKENGNIANTKLAPHSNGNNESKSIDLAPLSASDKNGGPSKELPSVNGVKPTQKKLNGTFRELFVKDIPKESVKPVLTPREDLLPRGLINPGNLCFLNATLQALLSCSELVKLLQEIRTRKIDKVQYPALAAFTEFLSDFDMPIGSNPNKDSSFLEVGRSFSPAMFEEVLRKFTPDVPKSISGRPRQEDAQEFLSFILHQLHDELIKLGGQSSNGNGAKSSLVSSADDDEWEIVGPKNKSAVTRTQTFVPSELSAIFGGQMRSVVKAKGNKASATVQPFLLLHLDVSHDSVRTIEDALWLFSAPETLDEYRTSTTVKAGVMTARKSVNLQTLPKVMVLHLMRFSYGRHGSTKIHKSVRFPLELVLSRDLLVSSATEGRRYELVSTITHHGREASKGHYTADARYPNGQWLHFDDATVTGIAANKVLQEQAYVLFYKQI